MSHPMSLPVLPDDPSTWLNVPPSTLPMNVEAIQASGESIVGWKWNTERASGECYRIGYMVVTTTGITHFGLDGIAVISSALHKVEGTDGPVTETITYI